MTWQLWRRPANWPWLILLAWVYLMASDCGKKETDEERDQRMGHPRYPY